MSEPHLRPHLRLPRVGAAGPRRGAALLTTVLLVTAAATMSAVLVRQSLSLARAESERLAGEQLRQCVDALQATMEAALATDPLALLGGEGPAPQLRGARLTTDAGAVLASGAGVSPGAVDSCRDGFNAAQHRISVSLPSAARSTLEVTYGAAQGATRAGRVVEYQLDSVSTFQVWSQELLDVNQLFSVGPEPDDAASGSSPELTTSGELYGAGVVGVATPSFSYPIGVGMSNLDEMVVAFSAPGGRRYRVTSMIFPQASSPSEVVAHQIVRNGLPIQGGLGVLANDVNVFTHELSVIDVPQAGTVVYRTRARFADTAGLNYSQDSFRPFLIVEDVGPAVLDPVGGRVAPVDGAMGLVALAPDRAAGGFVPPDPASLQAIGGASAPAYAGEVPMEVLFTPQPDRRYKVVSLTHLLAPEAAGALFTHSIAYVQDGATETARSSLVMAGNDRNPVTHQLEAVIGPFSSSSQVALSTRLSVTDSVSASGEPVPAFNYADGVLLPYIAVFDMGPATPVAVPPQFPAGLLAVVPDATCPQLPELCPDGAASSIGSGLQETAVLPFSELRGDRLLRIVSSPQIASATLSDVAVHQLARNGLALRSGLVPLDNDRNPVTHSLTLIEATPDAEVSYQTILRFSSGNTGEGAALNQGSFTPLLYVEDLGPVGGVSGEETSELAGAVYGASGVSLPLVTSTVTLGRERLFAEASPRHLQVFSPGLDPGISVAPNLSVYSDVVGTRRFPGGPGELGRIESPADVRTSGTGVRSAAAGSASTPAAPPPPARLDLPQLVSQVAERVALACDRADAVGLCLGPGELLRPEASRSRRPLGVVGRAAPAPGVNQQIGDELLVVPGHEVTLLSDGNRAYRIVSVLNPLSLVEGETLTHVVARDRTDIQAARVPLVSTQSALTSTQVAFDVPPAGLVTYTARARFDTDRNGTNVSSSGVGSFLVVEDLGPADGAPAPGDGAAGIRALAQPPATSRGYGQPLQQAPGQQVTFLAQEGRRYMIMSLVRPSSDAPGTVVTHQVLRTSAVGAVGEVSGSVRLGRAGEVGAHTLTAVVTPESGPVTYTTFLSFGSGTPAQNRNVRDGGHQPLLAVFDLGPSPSVGPELVSPFPAGLVAGPASTGQVEFSAAAGRLYRVEVAVVAGSGGAERLDLVRTVGGVTQTVQSVMLAPAEGGTPASSWFVALDAPDVATGTQVFYEAHPVTAGGAAATGVSTSLTVHDVGQSAGDVSAVATAEDTSGVVGTAANVRHPLGLVQAAAATFSGQEFEVVPTQPLGQAVTFEAAGNRRYRVTSVLHPYADRPGEMLRHEVVRSGAGSEQRVLQAALHPLAVGSAVSSSTVVVYDTPAPGRVTYATRAAFAERGAILADGQSRSLIIVEDVGPAVDATVPDTGAGGLLGRVGYAAPQTVDVTVRPDDGWVTVDGQTVSFFGSPDRQYQVVSSIRPLALPDSGSGVAHVVGHRVVRTFAGADVVLSEHLVDLANTTNVFSHTFSHLDVPPGSGGVTYRTEVRFFGGEGRNYRDDSFRPFIAVQDSGPAQDPGTFTSEPRGALGVWPETAPTTASVVVTGESGDLVTVVASVTVPEGRLYRVSSLAHPAFVGAEGELASFRHALQRQVGDGDWVPVQVGAGFLPEQGTGFSHQLETVDAPSAAGATVTYRAVLSFPTGTGYSAVGDGADGTLRMRPQLLVEDLGPAEAGTVFGYAAQAAPEVLSGAAKPTLLDRVPEDATSYRLTFAVDEDLRTTMLVESCKELSCSEGPVTGSFSMSMPASGLIVVPGHVVVSGRASESFTLIAGTVSRPADLVVHADLDLWSPVQLVATDRLLVHVPDGSRRARLDADLVALGLGSDGEPFGGAGWSWQAMLTLGGSVAGPQVDVASAFATAGPVRLEPRRFPRQAPWAVGFANEWQPVGGRLAGRSEVAQLFSR